MPGVYQNKMPVWEHLRFRDVFLFYTPSKRWMVGFDYHKDSGWVASKISGLNHLPLSGWQRVKSGGGWEDAPELRLELEIRYMATHYKA